MMKRVERGAAIMMRDRGARGVIAGALLLAAVPFVGAATSASATTVGAECPVVERVELIIDPQRSPVRRAYDRTSRTLTAMPGRGHAPPGIAKGAVLGLSTVRSGYWSEVGAIFSLAPRARVCGRLSSLRVRFGYEDRTVYVASELPRGSCIHKEVLDHELRHVAVDDTLLEEFLGKLRPRLEAMIARIGPVYAASQNRAMSVIRGAVDRELEAITRDFSRERDRLQATIDTAEEYRRVTNSCDGELFRYLKGGAARM